MDDRLDPEALKALRNEIDIPSWKALEKMASDAIDDKKYGLASQLYETLLEAVNGRLGRDDPNLLWVKRHYSETLLERHYTEEELAEIKPKSLNQVDVIHREIFDTVSHSSADTEGIIEDVLDLRLIRATELVQQKQIPPIEEAVLVLEEALNYSEDILGKKHDKTKKISKSLLNVKISLLKLQQKNDVRGSSRKLEVRLKPPNENPGVVHTRTPSLGSDGQLTETLRPGKATIRSASAHPAEDRSRILHAVKSPRAKLSDARLLSGSSDDYDTTDNWFIDYLSQTHDLITSLSPGKPRVRIAILDTGLNRDHQAVSEMLAKPNRDRRIKARECFIPAAELDDDEDPDNDPDGHGTHCAMVVHQVAPNADIYVARIFKDQNNVNGAHVVEAIEHAIEEWHVDIISMSFALSEVDRDLRDTIHAKLEENSTRKFPAIHPDIFCVHSATGNGNPSNFNPGGWLQDSSYSTLGEYVLAPHRCRCMMCISRESAVTNLATGVETAYRCLCTEPCCLCTNTVPETVTGRPCCSENEKPSRCHCLSRVSGTSVAAPVAAGIAALVLEFVQQSPVNNQRKVRGAHKLKTKAGMNAIFAKMCDPKSITTRTLDNLYFNLQPWHWLVLDPVRDQDVESARQRIAHDIDWAIADVYYPPFKTT